ncbi:glycoside hydrolase family 88 protein [Sphingomonas sp. BIUV-7]|uniref:Glycoside hydrolase family 88 protein n=1 Tax=Sphingomonas natans TaxID=3063330 RepID=A0ABT8Y5D4_9SPHN|nr:glycoside hydrolase family 88 protein [Sphingomonas sp. BIUV-7]MDO6412875.1 glycoside hydrolase family 88 protein [Sphingomonas sp. BIUV-7]
MTKRLSWLAAGTALLLTSVASAQPAPPQATAALPARPSMTFDANSVPDPARVLAVLDYSAAAQIAVQRAVPMTLRGDVVRQTTNNWVTAAFLTGLTRLTRVSDASGGKAFLRDAAEYFNFGLRGGSSAHGMLDADNIAVGETYLELYAHSGWANELAPLRERLDYTLPYLALNPAPKKLVWWWSDALFMAPPVYARMAVVAKDYTYVDAMDVQWWRTYDRLWAPQEGLYLRDERFATRHAKNGKRVFWARGNGWVMGGIPRVLENLPTDFKNRPRYIATLRTMSASLAKLQQKDGLWTSNLLDPTDPSGPESTGSAYFVYGMAWGINHGFLDRKTYLPVVLKGWAGLTAAIQPDGLLGYAQRTGDQPWPTAPGDHALYGTGALILAGLEMMKLNDPVGVLPVPEPDRDPAKPVVPLAPMPPAGMTHQEKAGFDRAIAERQAVRDLAFEPGDEAARPDQPPRADGIVNPKITLPLTPPADRSARASVKFAPYRYDDILWENDRTAHRIYGPALEGFEPPSTSGIDAWGKNVVWPFMERQLATGKQHDFHGEGIDFYNVNTFRGAGGLGVWQDSKLWVSRNWAKYRILKDGPDAADFEVDYAPWPVGIDRKAWETRRFTLPLGTNFTRMVSTIGSDKSGPMLVGVAIQKRATSDKAGSWKPDRATGRFTFWSPTDPDKGAMGIALMVDPAMIADVKEDADNYLILLRVTPAKPFVYYMGATWSKSLDFHDEAAWVAYVKDQKPAFGVPAR